MRKRQDDYRVAGRGGWDDFFGSFRWGNSDYQYSSARQRGGQNTIISDNGEDPAPRGRLVHEAQRNAGGNASSFCQ